MVTVLERFLPMSVSDVRPGYGSFFTIDLLSVIGTRRSLWIYLCGWAIVVGRDGALSSDSPKARIDDYLLRHWRPKQLLSARINIKTEIEFGFDNSRLRLFPYPEIYGADADIFRFFEDDKLHYLRFEDRKIKEIASGRTVLDT